MATVSKSVDKDYVDYSEYEDYGDPDFKDDVQLFREDCPDEGDDIYADPDFQDELQLFLAEPILVLDNDFV